MFASLSASQSPSAAGENLGSLAAGALLLGIIAIVVLAAGQDGAQGTWSWRTQISGIGLMTMVAAASFATGGLVGFIFGIPRLPDAGCPTGDGERNGTRANGGSVALNSNLGQVSDWLTKILLGAGLTHITQIGGTLQGIAAEITAPNNNLASFIPVIIVYFAVLGFMIFYVWTNIRFSGLVNEAHKHLGELREQLSSINAKTDRVLDKVEEAKNACALIEDQFNLENSERDHEIEDLTKALAPLDGSDLRTIFYKAQRVRHESWQWNKRRMERTIPIFQALIKLDKSERYHRNHAQLGYCYKDKLKPDYHKAIECLDEAIARRIKLGREGWTIYEFNRALCRIQLTLQGKPQDVQTIIDDLEAAAAYPHISSVLAQPGADPVLALSEVPEILQWCERNAERIKGTRLAGILEASAASPRIRRFAEASD